MSTLTLSGVEQAAVLRHLQLQHDRLPTDAPDRVLILPVLELVAQHRTVDLSRMQAVVMLRYLRKQSQAIGVDLTALEERRIRGGFNGHLDAAHAALDADKMMLDDVVRRLWAIVL